MIATMMTTTTRMIRNPPTPTPTPMPMFLLVLSTIAAVEGRTGGELEEVVGGAVVIELEEVVGGAVVIELEEVVGGAVVIGGIVVGGRATYKLMNMTLTLMQQVIHINNCTLLM